MANLSLAANWNAGIYQLETSDPVQGGPSGISNLQPKQLGDRTEWLKEKVDDLLAGNIQIRSVFIYSSNQTLTIDNTGGLVVFTGTASVTMTLPDIADADALLDGQAILFKNKNTFNFCTVKTFDDDGTTFDNGEISIFLKPDDVLMVVRKGDTYYTVYVRERGVPAGTVNAYAGNTIPDGWLSCNGFVVSRSQFPELFRAIGTTYNTGGESGSEFRLPDLRGEFIRGLDGGRGVDTGRALGSAQSDLLKAHTHGLTQVGISTSSGANSFTQQTTGVPNGATASTGGAETRPRNVAMNFIIKF
jgi:microcystin-dependent protein